MEIINKTFTVFKSKTTPVEQVNLWEWAVEECREDIMELNRFHQQKIDDAHDILTEHQALNLLQGNKYIFLRNIFIVILFIFFCICNI